MQFTLLTANVAPQAPFTVGFAFRRGDIPSGQSAVCSTPDVQVVPKNRWPDGSLKFAIVSGLANLSGNTPLTVSLAAGSSAAGAPLTTADLRATSITASIACGSFGSVSWAGADWDAPLQTWVSGPQMSSWIYRKPVGSDAHLVAWLEVRLYAGGAVEVLPWVENGYLFVPAPTAKNAIYTFALGGTTRFSATIDLPNHSRTPLLSGTALSHWLGNDPGVTPFIDSAYLQATKIVPTYHGTTPATAEAVNNLATSFAPLQQGGFPGVMGTTGYHPSIGLLPQWDVLYLTCTNSTRPYEAVVRNGYSAGRYGIHFRDESTFKPLRFSSYPRLVCSGGSHGVASSGNSSTGQETASQSLAATGTQPPAFKISHHPSMGYMAYLLTGRFYFMEQVQFVATLNYLANSDVNRQGAGGVFLTHAGSNTPRGAAWAMRSLAQAATVTPDSDALQLEFVNSVAANAAHYYSTFVGQANNAFGLTTPYSDTNTSGIYVSQPWMDNDFVVAAWGYAKCLQLPMTAEAQTRFDAFFAWKARSVVGRLGGVGPDEYLFRDAARVEMAFAPSDAADFQRGTGPWYASWGAIYDATMNPANRMTGGYPGAKEIGDNTLRGGNFPDPSSYWGNLLPAISYAVQHGVSGAQAGYDRILGASNWATLRSGFNATPEWGVRPASSN